MQKKPTHLKLPGWLTAIAVSTVLLWSCNDAADSTAAPAASKPDSAVVKPDSTPAATKVADTLPPIDTTASTRPPDPGTKKTK